MLFSQASVYSIDKIELNGCNQQSTELLFDQLSDNKKAIEMSNMQLSDQCVASIVHYLSHSSLPIQSLALANNEMQYLGVLALKQWSNSKKKLPEHLDISHNDLRPTALMKFGELLHENKEHPIESLDLSGIDLNQLDEKRFQKLLVALRPLKSIVFKHCQLTQAHMGMVAQLLIESESLSSLDLSYNAIQDAGLQTLTTGLADNTSLERLNLAFTHIGNEGAKTIEQWLTKTDRSLEINLKYNYFSDKYDNLFKKEKIGSSTIII